MMPPFGNLGNCLLLLQVQVHVLYTYLLTLPPTPPALPNQIQNWLAALFRCTSLIGGPFVDSFVNKAVREKHYPKLHYALERHLRMLHCNGRKTQW